MRLGFTNDVSSKERLSSTKRQKQDIQKKSYRQKKGVSVLLKRMAEISEDSLVAICILFVSRDLLPPLFWNLPVPHIKFLHQRSESWGDSCRWTVWSRTEHQGTDPPLKKKGWMGFPPLMCPVSSLAILRAPVFLTNGPCWCIQAFCLGFLFLWRDTMATATLLKENISLELAYKFQCLILYHYGV